MRYECSRCHEMCNTLDPPHLCADLRKRHERQAKAVALVVEVLNTHKIRTRWPDIQEQIALDIVKALTGRDLGT